MIVASLLPAAGRSVPAGRRRTGRSTTGGAACSTSCSPSCPTRSRPRASPTSCTSRSSPARRTDRLLAAAGLRAAVVDVGLFPFPPELEAARTQIRRVEELSDAYHVRLGGHDVMVAYLLEIRHARTRRAGRRSRPHGERGAMTSRRAPERGRARRGAARRRRPTTAAVPGRSTRIAAGPPRAAARARRRAAARGRRAARRSPSGS